MCIALAAFDRAGYALIVCTNRDEFLDRPTLDAHWHAFEPLRNSADPVGAPSDGSESLSVPPSEASILSGRDAAAGGTWFGVSRNAKVALLTNITEPFQQFATSRGALASEFLLAPRTPAMTVADEAAAIVAENERFAGFNLLLFDRPSSSRPSLTHPLVFEAMLVTNGGAGSQLSARALTPEERRAVGVSNGIDDHGGAQWPKVCKGVELFTAALEFAEARTQSLGSSNEMLDDEESLVERLFDLLLWHPDEDIHEHAHLRETIHVLSHLYGTRLSTVFLVRRDGRALFCERDIWKLGADGRPERGDPAAQRVCRFQMDI
ncbi:DUF833-domain-containing protein [Fistulina hepatica ATCC 64428]|uniref:DUF833-domain-containing protein n=1 Tax=Fistulina hepatica ATCC 64428 TaxID=1128425 RepID=A0A0D7AI07_9AGAR|nr:DUF833-domain-containing protein [Fistulina hepatica ATCC 64428]